MSCVSWDMAFSWTIIWKRKSVVVSVRVRVRVSYIFEGIRYVGYHRGGNCSM